MEPLHYPLAALPAGMGQNQAPVESFNGQIWVEEAAVAEQREGSPQASTIGREARSN